jgi:hypothetical protein
MTQTGVKRFCSSSDHDSVSEVGDSDKEEA